MNNKKENHYQTVEEFLDEENNYITVSPEKNFLYGFLERAIKDLVDAEPEIRQDAWEWFLDTDAVEEWGTFLYTCTQLNISDPISLRDRIFEGALNQLQSVRKSELRRESLNGVQGLSRGLRKNTKEFGV